MVTRREICSASICAMETRSLAATGGYYKGLLFDDTMIGWPSMVAGTWWKGPLTRFWSGGGLRWWITGKDKVKNPALASGILVSIASKRSLGRIYVDPLTLRSEICAYQRKIQYGVDKNLSQSRPTKPVRSRRNTCVSQCYIQSLDVDNASNKKSIILT